VSVAGGKPVGSGQGPGSVPAGEAEAEAEHAAEVDRGGADVEPGIVLGHAVVAQFQAAAAAGGQVRDDPFDLRPVLAVGGLEGGGVGLLAGGAQQRVVLAQAQGAAVLAGGAAFPQGAGAA